MTTKKLQQHVVPRRRSRQAVFSYRTQGGGWSARSRSRRGVAAARSTVGQQGAISQSTITLGFAVIALIGVVLIGFVYLQQVFGTASQGEDIQHLEQQLVDLKEQQRELELQGAELRSIQTVEETVQQLNLVTTDRVAYLSPERDRVAQTTP